ncbi:unnamed protein product [Macrosiphum euphorbiae]|uniref:Uncharacterized protein n=1 Tax=Macrosiphum euphorbiae TaxID=13131 RepID=A0AAV0WSI1_9HEMI|nr:unnamed protein product [Macrosiphum euphorbiae]
MLGVWDFGEGTSEPKKSSLKSYWDPAILKYTPQRSAVEYLKGLTVSEGISSSHNKSFGSKNFSTTI